MRAELADAHHACIGATSEISHSNDLVPDVEQRVVGQRESRSFPLELKHDETVVVTGRKQVEVRVGSQNPESIVFPSESLNGGSLGHVPDSDGLVFTVRKDQFVAGMEKRNGHIVEVTSTGVDFPCLGIAHTPEFDLSIITARDDQW